MIVLILLFVIISAIVFIFGCKFYFTYISPKDDIPEPQKEKPVEAKEGFISADLLKGQYLDKEILYKEIGYPEEPMKPIMVSRRNEVVESVKAIGTKKANSLARETISGIESSLAVRSHSEIVEFCRILEEMGMIEEKTCVAISRKCEMFEDYYDAIEWLEIAEEISGNDYSKTIDRLSRKT